MAEKVEIDIPGIGLIEAKNAATEATLLEILEVMKGTQKSIQQQAKNKGKESGSGSGPSKADAGNMASFNKEQQAAGKSFSVLGAAARGAGMAFTGVGKAAGIAVGGFNRMASGAGVAAGATMTFGRKALEAGESMTDLIERMANVGDSTTAAANALRVIPGVGGILANVLGAVAGQIEKSVASYQAAASVGATFSGSVNDMSRAASGAGMTMDQFAGLIKNNSESLMLLGGTTEQGAKQFASLAKDIQQSGVGSELQRLGYTTEQINGGMAKYINIIGKTGALQGMSSQQIAASSGAYLKELDALAKITGVSREEKEKEHAALMSDAKVRAAMAGLDAESQKQMMAYITSFPKEQQAAIADMIATGNTTTDEAIQLQSMLPGVAAKTMEFGRILQAGGRVSQDALNQTKNSAITEAQESVKRNKMRGMYDEQAGKQFVGMANLAAQKVDGYSQAIGEQGKATEKANLAENLTKAKQRLAEFSNSFSMALANSGMLDTLMNVFETLGNLVMTTVVPIFKLFAEALNTVIPMVTAFLVPAFKMLGEFVNNTIVPAFQILSDWVNDGLMPIFTSLWGTVSTVVESLSALVGGVMGTVSVVEDIFEPALYAISDFIEDNLAPALATLAVVAIPPLIARMATMAMSMLGTIANFIALNLPMIGFTVAVGAMIFLFKKFGVDLGVVTDALKWAGSWISTLFLKLQHGIYSLLNKIPGMRGDFDKDLKSISEKMEENEKDRGKLEQNMADRRTKNLEAEAKKETTRADRDEKRAERRGKREEDAIERKKRAELDAVGAKEKREKEAEDAKKEPTVDLSNPIQMLKTFAAQQKSAFSQEAKALDDKEKARSEMKMANDGYSKALEARNKAEQSGTAEEKKAAEAALADAEKRQKAAQEGQDKANEEVTKATARMKAAKEGKDPGPTKVAEGKPREEKKPEAAKPEAAKSDTAVAAKSAGAAPAPLKQDQAQNMELIKAALQKQGITDPKYIAATLGNVMKETGGKSIEENLNYGKTSNDRIRTIFGSRASGKTDKELDQIKSDPKQMGEMMYGSTTKMGKQMGNNEPGDGFKYRGRGFIQLTGKSNYAAASKAIYGDNRLVDNPDLVNDPAVAAEVSAWYMKKGQAGMAKKMGIDTGNMSQQQANDLATSQIAGTAIKRGSGYLGNEVINKVDKYSAQMTGIAGAPVAPGTPKPSTAGVSTADAAKARTDAAATDPRRTDKTETAKPVETKPVETKPVTAEGKPATDVSENPLQGLMKDGIIPTTLAFQELVSKGLKPFQGMMSGVQTKVPLEAKPVEVKPVEVKPVEAKPVEVKPVEVKPVEAKPVEVKPVEVKPVEVKPEDSLKKGEEIVKDTAQSKERGNYDAEASKAYVSIAKISTASLKSVNELGQNITMADGTNPETGEKMISAQSEAITASMTAGAAYMFTGFTDFGTNFSNNMISNFDVIGSDLTSGFSDSFQLAMDDSLGLFNTDLSDNFSAFETLDIPSMVTGLDNYTKEIYAASDEIAKGEAAIAQQETAIAEASANLVDPSVTNKDEIAAAVTAMQNNIQMQKATIAHNKDVIDKNIMARAETPLNELVAQANSDAQEKIRAAEEAAALKESELSSSTQMASAAQEGALSGSSDLNIALAELISISKRTAELNEKQLSVQSSLSGDLFA